MNKLSTFALCSALSGLFLLTTAFGTKNDTVPPAPAHSADLVASLVGTRWQMADFKLDQDIDFDGDGHLDTNLMAFMKPCDLDNTLTFEPNGTVAIEAGNLKCNGDATTPKLGNWQYDQATNSLTIVRPNGTKATTWQIIDASDNYLKVKVITPKGGSSSAATITWKTL